MFLWNVGAYLPSPHHKVTTQKTNIDIFTSVRTSNFRSVTLLRLYEEKHKKKMIGKKMKKK
jgi:hypothetical protein